MSDGISEVWRESHPPQETAKGKGASPASPCSSITLNFRGDPSKPHDICQCDYDKLKGAGFLWEFYPDAPDVFPTNAEYHRPEGDA